MAPRLSRSQQQELKHQLDDQCWTTREVADKIGKIFCVKYSLRSVVRLQKRLGLCYAKHYPARY